MIDGIDLLFAVLCLVLIFLLIEGWDRYNNWYEWDRDRRHQRKRFLYEFKDELDEARYRQHLRLIFRFRNLTTAFGHMTTAANEVSKSLNAFSKILQKISIK